MDGNFAEYLLADSNNVLPLPEELEFTDAVTSYFLKLTTGSTDVCRSSSVNTQLIIVDHIRFFQKLQSQTWRLVVPPQQF
jgi:NADPH:quinone reductase-like Zn-dependent oxidoreductase